MCKLSRWISCDLHSYKVPIEYSVFTLSYTQTQNATGTGPFAHDGMSQTILLVGSHLSETRRLLRRKYFAGTFRTKYKYLVYKKKNTLPSSRSHHRWFRQRSSSRSTTPHCSSETRRVRDNTQKYKGVSRGSQQQKMSVSNENQRVSNVHRSYLRRILERKRKMYNGWPASFADGLPKCELTYSRLRQYK